jgi:hypothetical protein
MTQPTPDALRRDLETSWHRFLDLYEPLRPQLFRYALMERGGAVFADHYHSCVLASPTELVNAIRYVLGNAAHHFGRSGTDPFSSAALEPTERDRVLARAVGWLLRAGRFRSRTAPPSRAPQLH